MDKNVIKREYVSYGKDTQTYDLVGFSYTLRLSCNCIENITMKSASYRLDYIGEMEVGEKKVPMMEV